MNITRAVSCVLFVFLYVINADPEIRIQVYEPQGLRVILIDSISNANFLVPQPNYIKFVDFTGSVVRGKLVSDFGAWFGTMFKDGDWIYENPKLKLHVDDEVRVDVFMSNDYSGCTNSTPLPELHRNESSYFIYPGNTFRKRIVVKEFLKNFKGGKDCVPSATILRSGAACSGQTVFEDHFNTLDTDVWQIEHYIPRDHPEYPFVSYQRMESNSTVYVEDGKLHIQPRLQEALPNFNKNIESLVTGTLDLSAGCTGRTCVQHAMGDVLPPVVSGRVTSARFAFTYGIVTIRAKLPQGDWLYPEILLEPLTNKYGSENYASGVIKIAMALGNKASNMRNFNNKWLSGWLILNEKCHFALRLNDARNQKKILWGADFHEYTLKWTPEGMEFSVDGETYGNYTINDNGFREWMPSRCVGDLHKLWTSADRLAPFNDHFYITLGVAAGGMAEFPDRMQSNGKPKPWRNGSKKAVLNFLQDKETWFPTWTDSALVVDSIKVVAL